MFSLAAASATVRGLKSKTFPELLQFGEQLRRLFFRDEVAALQRPASHVGSDLAPVLHAVEQRLDHALPAPQGEQRHVDLLPQVLLVVHPVDGRGSAGVLARRVDGARLAKAARVLGYRAAIKTLELRASASNPAEDVLHAHRR